MINPVERTGTWRAFSVSEGLAGVCVEHIAEDGEGCLWFASFDGGASRFDGDTFRNVNVQDGLPDETVYIVVNDSRNRLWFGTAEGVCWYDGAEFHTLKDDGIAGRAVHCIYEDREGHVWFGGQCTLGYYDGRAFHDMIPCYLKRYPEPPSVHWRTRCRGIAQDSDGDLWFGNDYLIRFDGSSFSRIGEYEDFPKRSVSYAVGQDDAGRIWVGHRGLTSGACCYSEGAFQPVQVNPGGALRKIQKDREGRLWFCTSEGALYQDGDGFGRFTPDDGLPHAAVMAVFQDRERQFWFATWNGVGLYDARGISVFDMGAELYREHCQISRVVQDRRGNIWIGLISPDCDGLARSLFRFDGDRVEYVCAEDGCDINNCFAIHEDLDGRLWFGGRRGLFTFDGRALKQSEEIAAVGRNSVCAIAQDPGGRFLFGYWESDVRKGEEKTRRELSESRMKIIYDRGERFHTVILNRVRKDPFGRIGALVAGRDGEVYFFRSRHTPFDPGEGFARWHSGDGIRYRGTADGLTDQQVVDLLLDHNGSLWIATRNGLACCDGETIRTVETEEGLKGERIRCMIMDRRGHLWLGTDRGVIRYNGQFFQSIKSPYIGTVVQILEDRDGTFWFGTLSGCLVRYRAGRTPPRVRLLRVVTDRVNDEFEEVISSAAGEPVVFEYKGLSYSTHPRDMLYVYRLTGYDPDWQPATRKLRVVYRDLPPGVFTFEVRAIDRDFNQSEIANARLSLETAPSTGTPASIRQVTDGGGREIIGASEAMKGFRIRLAEAACTELTVLILGETGVGKGLAARVLHEISDHGKGPFVRFNSGGVPESLIISELFGHERGAFTSAVTLRVGKVELADSGTLFLDEIGDMTLQTQTSLLRLLDDGTFERIGSNDTINVRTRIVAATNRNLEEMVRAGDFREDLYYRLHVFPLYLPPLRERKDDIPELAEYFRNRVEPRVGKTIAPLSNEIIEALSAYDWPGNVRELEHLIQRAAAVCRGSHIALKDLGTYRSPIRSDAQNLEWTPLSAPKDREVVPLAEFERRYILEVLKRTKWRISGKRGAATLLGVPPSSLYGKMRKLKIERP